MAQHPRTQRVADRIQAELADILQRRMKDPRHGFLTLTGVEMSPDLRVARVFVSSLGVDDLEASLTTLEHAKGFLRRELGRRLDLRHVPELVFRPDRSAANAQRVSELLARLQEKGDPPPDDAP
jgi:ribosome-binding factor A